MKKVYLVLRDGRPEFVFSSRKKAEQELKIIIDSVKSGKYIKGENWSYREVIDFKDGNGHCYEVTNTLTGHSTKYRILEMEVNFGYKM